MHQYLRLIPLTATILLLSACIVVPSKKEPVYQSDSCQLWMPKWELSVETFHEGSICNGSFNQGEEACLLTLGIVVPAGSLVVSGSVVVVGNSLRWLEYQGRCEQGVIQRSMNLLKGKAKNKNDVKGKE